MKFSSALPEYRDSRQVGAGPRARLVIESTPVGVLRHKAQRFDVFEIVDPGPYRGRAGAAVCQLVSRRGAKYLVLRTAAGRLIVFNNGERGGSFTPWSRSSHSPFGEIDAAELAPFLPSLGVRS